MAKDKQENSETRKNGDRSSDYTEHRPADTTRRIDKSDGVTLDNRPPPKPKEK